MWEWKNKVVFVPCVHLESQRMETAASSSSILSIPADPGVVDLRSCMHEMHVDERRTCESMVRGVPGSSITPMPTHQIDQHGRCVCVCESRFCSCSLVGFVVIIPSGSKSVYVFPPETGSAASPSRVRL